jgi:hypothetical protein
MASRATCRLDVRVLVIALAVLVAAPAAAQPAEPAIAWDAPPTCPTRSDVETRIASRAGAAVGGLDDRVSVAVTREAGAFVARVELDSTDDREVRALSAASCEEIADAVSVIVARLARTRVAPAAATVPKFVATADSEDPPDVEVHAPIEPDAAPPQWDAGARASGLAMYGLMPRQALGGEVAVFVTRGALRFEVARAYWQQSHGPSAIAMLDGVLVDFRATTARVAWFFPDVPVLVRGIAELGSMRGTGVGEFAGQTGWVTDAAVGAGLGADWRATRWLRVVAASDVAVAIDRTQFVLDNGTLVFEPGRVSLRFSVGIEVGLR